MKDTFSEYNLNPSLVAALEKESIVKPTEIQDKVIAKILEKKDLIAQSETGTGKTLAYLLPLFQNLNVTIKEMQAIILVPTHELAIQVQRQIERLSENSDIKVNSTTIIGNVNIERQVEKLKERPHIIVGSAGRILELIKKKKISAHTIKTIILDEADRLVDRTNIEGVKAVVKCTLKDRQMMMFSASISKETIATGKEMMKDPEIIRGEEKITIPETIEHIYFLVEQRDKIEVLRKLIRMLNPPKAIAFINQGLETSLFSQKLNYHGLNAVSLHGANKKLDRKKTMEDFKAGKIQVLVASDIAARGLQIEGVTHIFNISMPEDPKDYLHRVGRSGRNGNQGLAISVVTERELPLISLYEKTFKIKIARRDMYMGQIVESRKDSNKGMPKKPE